MSYHKFIEVSDNHGPVWIYLDHLVAIRVVNNIVVLTTVRDDPLPINQSFEELMTKIEDA